MYESPLMAPKCSDRALGACCVLGSAVQSGSRSANSHGAPLGEMTRSHIKASENEGSSATSASASTSTSTRAEVRANRDRRVCGRAGAEGRCGGAFARDTRAWPRKHSSSAEQPVCIRRPVVDDGRDDGRGAKEDAVERGRELVRADMRQAGNELGTGAGS
jgi:hypothetical protein